MTQTATTVFVECYFCHQLKDCHLYGFSPGYAACDRCAVKNQLTMDCDKCGTRVPVRVNINVCTGCEAK